MLETIAIILLVLWLLGVVSGYTLGNFIYVLLVIAIILFLVRLVSGRRVRVAGALTFARLSCAPDYRGAREHDGACHGDSCAERLAEHDGPKQDGDHGIDVRVERDRRDGRCLSAYAYENPTIDPTSSK